MAIRLPSVRNELEIPAATRVPNCAGLITFRPRWLMSFMSMNMVPNQGGYRLGSVVPNRAADHVLRV